MSVTESTDVFSIACLNQLAFDLATPGFVPNKAQKVIFNQALRLLDLELSYQAAEDPELVRRLDQWLESDR